MFRPMTRPPDRASAGPGRRRPFLRRRLVPVIGAAAFLLQILLWPVFAAAMAAGAVTPVCIAAAPNGTVPDSPKTTPTGETCALCQLAQSLGAPPPAAADVVPPVFNFPQMRFFIAAGSPVAGWFLSTLQARGPPAPEPVRSPNKT